MKEHFEKADLKWLFGLRYTNVLNEIHFGGKNQPAVRYYSEMCCRFMQ